MNRLVLFLTILEILDDESSNTTFRNKNGGTNLADQIVTINLCEIRS